MAKVGDTVRYLNDIGGGKIIRIDGNIAVVDDDGFETPVLLRECVVVSPAAPTPVASAPTASASVVHTVVANELESEVEDIEETEGGESLNITIGFEPTERTRLSETSFDASLINDSNYFLYFALLSRDNDARDWTCRYAGTVEPNTELWLGTYERKEIAEFDRLCLQYIAFKRHKEFTLKAPSSVELKIDTTKFFKLHCFRANPYFENEVLAFDFVKNDKSVNDGDPDRAMLTKMAENIHLPKDAKTQPHSGHLPRRFSPRHSAEPLVVDLHIDSLVDTRAGMSPADILNFQVDTFQRIMNENLRNYGRKIIFIHGKGEGVLRQAIMKELNHRYRGHDVQDASFQEYGYGATQVTIRQHPDKFHKYNKK